MTYEEKLELARRFNKRFVANGKVNKINVDKMIDNDEINKEDMHELIDIYPKWEDLIGTWIDGGKRIQYNGKLYNIIKGLTLLENWKPDEVPSEFDPVFPENIIPEWEQRYGHNQYQPGDFVRWQGEIYKCKNPTSYSPSDVPGDWIKQ